MGNLPDLFLTVDLRNPARLARINEEFLKYSACPIQGTPCPGLLKIVTLRLSLPEGEQWDVEAQVVSQVDADRFVVQLLEPLNTSRLDFLARLASRTQMAPSSWTDSVDVVIPPRRRRVHLPRESFGTRRSPSIEPVGGQHTRLSQPPPRVARDHLATPNPPKRKA